MTKLMIESVEVEHLVDENPDLSYLETEWNEDNTEIVSSFQYTNEDIKEQGLDVVRDWTEKDKRRIEAYNSGQWGVIGIRAKATVKYSTGGSNFRLETFTSSGLWGIETDSDEKYIKETENDQLAELKEHLEMFNIDTSNFDELAEAGRE